MGFDEEGVGAGGDGGFGEGGDEFALAAGGGAESAGEHGGMGGIKTDGEAKLLHDGNGAHVADEIVVAKRGAALSEDDARGAAGGEFFDDVFHVPRREELPFFDVDGGGRLRGGGEEIGLAAEKGGDLDDVANSANKGSFFGRVDVGDDGEIEFPLDALEDFESFVKARTAERLERGAIGFVVGGFKDELKGEGGEELFERAGGAEGEVFALDDAGAAKDGERLIGSNEKVFDRDEFHTR